MPRAKVAPPAALRAPSIQPAEGNQELLKVSESRPSRPRNTYIHPWKDVSPEQSSLVAVARNMAGEEKLSVSISSGGSPRERRKRNGGSSSASPSLLLHHPSFTRGGKLSAGNWGRAGGPCARGRALTSVSGRGAARPASSKLRAAVPGPGRRCAGCIATVAAAASAQPLGALHAEGRVAPGRWVPPASHRSGAHAQTAPPATRRSLRARRWLLSLSPATRSADPPPPPPQLSDPGQGRARSPEPGVGVLHLPAGFDRTGHPPPATVLREAVAAQSRRGRGKTGNEEWRARRRREAEALRAPSSAPRCHSSPSR